MPQCLTKPKPLKLIAAACGCSIGAALLQDGRPIAFMCRKSNAAECKYGVGEQRLLAVDDAMRALLFGGGEC